MKYDYKKKHKVGDIIYPYYNGTSGFFKIKIWSVVVRVDKKGYWKELEHWYNNETARLYSMILRKDAKKDD